MFANKDSLDSIYHFLPPKGEHSLKTTISMNDYQDLLEKYQALQKIHQNLQDDHQHLQKAYQALQEGLHSFVKASTETYNLLAQLVKDQKLLPGNELAVMAVNNMQKLKEEKDPIDLLHLLEAYKRQLIKPIGNGFKTRPPATGTEERVIPRALTKVNLRANQIIEYTKQKLETAKERVQVTSMEVRHYLAGLEGKAPNRRDAIRALQRAAQIFPALDYGAIPNDKRGVKRLTLTKDHCPDILSDQDKKRYHLRQAREEEIRQIFFKQEVSRA